MELFRLLPWNIDLCVQKPQLNAHTKAHVWSLNIAAAMCSQ